MNENLSQLKSALQEKTQMVREMQKYMIMNDVFMQYALTSDSDESRRVLAVILDAQGADHGLDYELISHDHLDENALNYVHVHFTDGRNLLIYMDAYPLEWNIVMYNLSCALSEILAYDPESQSNQILVFSTFWMDSMGVLNNGISIRQFYESSMTTVKAILVDVCMIDQVLGQKTLAHASDYEKLLYMIAHDFEGISEDMLKADGIVKDLHTLYCRFMADENLREAALRRKAYMLKFHEIDVAASDDGYMCTNGLGQKFSLSNIE